MMNNLLTIIILSAALLSSCQQTKQKKVQEEKKVIIDSKITNDIRLLSGSWIQPNPISEKEVQGFKLNADGSASSINMMTLIYKKWWLTNGKLFLVTESIGNHTSSTDTSIYEMVKITEDSLIIKNESFVEKYAKQ